MTSQFTRSRNAFPGIRAACILISAMLVVGCGQPESSGAADAASPQAAPVQTETADSAVAPAPEPADSEDKKTLLNAIQVSESTAAAAAQSQQDRQAIIDAAGSKTDAQLKEAADAAASAETP